jgi:hypothetical protein
MATSKKKTTVRKPAAERKPAAAKKTSTKKAAARKASAKPAAARKKTAARRARTAAGSEDLRGAARKAATFLGMNPDEVEATAGKLRDQTVQAGKRVREEIGRLADRADDLTARFDRGLKQGVEKAEQLADEVARGLGIDKGDLSKKVNARMERLSREATRLAEEAEAEARKMYEQARQRLNEILSKRK